jgi:4-phospho-D-threonate 3-dehydrogenase / 4-phospho-D-erythronate 3-dehydrogenase
MKKRSKPVVIGVTVGDPAGIGPEIVVKALLKQKYPGAQPVVFADRAVLEQAMEITGKRAAIIKINKREDIRYGAKGIQFVPGNVIRKPVAMGEVSRDCGRAAYVYFASSLDWALDGRIDGVATAPLQKEALQLGGCDQLDHTGILKHKTGSADTTTLFMTGRLRVFFLTRHLPLRDVAWAVRKDDLDAAIPRCLGFLKQLGIRSPKLAVAALNPHGGEEGMFGREEKEILLPSVQEARHKGLNVFGPIPADSVFHMAKEGAYDGVISLYHDQGHIATKTLNFYRTVSLTMGLPFLRTSVDHGTAFNIAGKNVANETSMVEAIRAAVKYAGRIKTETKGARA